MRTADSDETDRRRRAIALKDLRGRHRLLGHLELLREPVDDLSILGGVLGIGGVLVVSGAAHEVCALWVNAGKRPRRDAVAVDVEVAREALDALERFRIEHFAPIRPVFVVPR